MSLSVSFRCLWRVRTVKPFTGQNVPVEQTESTRNGKVLCWIVTTPKNVFKAERVQKYIHDYRQAIMGTDEAAHYVSHFSHWVPPSPTLATESHFSHQVPPKSHFTHQVPPSPTLVIKSPLWYRVPPIEPCSSSFTCNVIAFCFHFIRSWWLGEPYRERWRLTIWLNVCKKRS